MSDIVNWLNYEFQICDPSGNWNEVAGLYIFASLNSVGRWKALYIGSTESLASRLSNHPMWPVAVQLGATHIHAKVEQNMLIRLAQEQELIRSYQPRLNDQHR